MVTTRHPPRPIPRLGGAELKKAIGDVPIRDQLDVYLKRLRRTVPFPITPEEAYFGCMPSVISRMHQESLFDKGAPKPGKVSNLLLCLTRSGVHDPHVKAMPNIVHVNLEGSDVYSKKAGAEDVFWFIAPDGVPSPVYRHGEQFYLPEDHPHHVAIRQWVYSCLKIEDGIQRAFAAIAKLESNLANISHVAVCWPELMNFIKFRRIVSGPTADAQRSRERIERSITPAERLNTIELLTTCVMLPEKNTPLSAWVNFYMEGL